MFAERGRLGTVALVDCLGPLARAAGAYPATPVETVTITDLTVVDWGVGVRYGNVDGGRIADAAARSNGNGFDGGVVLNVASNATPTATATPVRSDHDRRDSHGDGTTTATGGPTTVAGVTSTGRSTSSIGDGTGGETGAFDPGFGVGVAAVAVTLATRRR